MQGVFSERVLLNNQAIVPAAIFVEDGRIAEIREGQQPVGSTDLGSRLLMPGLVDLHGDSFERQLMPRPGVLVDPLLALFDTDCQLVANGITTAFHGVTWSWESGLRSTATGHRWIDAIGANRSDLAADHRIHLRFEAYAHAQLNEALQMIERGLVDLVAFNDHTPGMFAKLDDAVLLSPLAQRGQLSIEALRERLLAVRLSATGLGLTIGRVLAAAVAKGIPMLSHDDRDPEHRRAWRKRGVRICEFPIRMETAEHASSHGEPVVAGAPNVMRGGSHLGWVSAADMVAAGHCTILATDYWYPSLLQAPWRLARDGILPLARAIGLVTAAPASAAGLADRGVIAVGRRADLVLVDDTGPAPRIAATWTGGQRVFGTGLGALD